MNDFKFETNLINGYRLGDWRRDRCPPGHEDEDMKSRGIFVCLWLTGEDGKRYHSQRAFDSHGQGLSSLYGFFRFRDGDRHSFPDDLWSDVPKYTQEPYTYTENLDSLVFTVANGRLELLESGWNWYDAGGRWDLSVRPLGDRGYSFWVPRQAGFDIPHYHQGQCYWAEGTVNGQKVRGYGYLERAWSTGGLEIKFWNLPLVRKMNKLWMHFYASFEDGSYVTGCARKGRLGVNWSMAYVVNNGVADMITPTATDICYTEDGLVKHVRLNTGKQVFEFEQDCATYFPYHMAGRIASVTGRGKVADSWTETEWWPDNAPEVMDWIAERESEAKPRHIWISELPIIGEQMMLPKT